MELPITTISTSILAVLFVGLSLRIINMRRTGVGPSVGIEGGEKFVRAVRSHANLGEYAPFFLILLGLYEVQTESNSIALGLALVFIVSRIAHAIGFGFIGKGPLRTLGMVGTNAALLILSTLNILILF